jgi:riboflavin synthase
VFTGLIQDIGRAETVEGDGEGACLRIATSLGPEIGLGDSVAVNGVCLTATAADPAGFDTEAMNQTLAVTALSDVVAGSRVNLELAMRASDRFGGHIVQGHVDGVAAVLSTEEDGFARRLRVALGPDLTPYMVRKGSMTLSGVSLTIAELGEDWVEVSLIPETLERTNLGEVGPGDNLNVECDIVAKYVERLLAPFAGKERA